MTDQPKSSPLHLWCDEITRKQRETHPDHKIVTTFEDCPTEDQPCPVKSCKGTCAARPRGKS